jgi:outer membrane protein assembly factor BamB
MKKSFNKTTTASIALILMLTFSTAALILPLASAHEPAWEIPTYAYIAVSPDPVGVGQSVWVMFWLDKVPPTATGISGERWEGFEIVITDPQGNVDTRGPFTSDPIGGGWLSYTPDQIGTYTFEFSFPGQVADLYGPTGVPGTPSPYENDTYLPSSTSTTLTVTEEPVTEPPTYPLPTEYWTRPIEGENTAWSAIASNYLAPFGAAFMAGSERLQPNGAAPDSSHIMWTKPLEFGGVVGGGYAIDGVTFYTGLSYESRFSSPIIIYGRLYYQLPLGNSGTGGDYVCVDLRTGETIWTKEGINPTFGQLFDYESMNQHGVVGGILWQVSGGGGLFGPPAPQNWTAYDPQTGDWLFTLTNVPGGSNVYGPNGEITRYIIDTTNNWMAVWNNTQDNVGLHGAIGTGTDAYQWRPVGKTVDMSEAYTWNVTLSSEVPVGSSIIKVIPDDLVLVSTSTLPPGVFFGWGTVDYTVSAISLKPGTRGQLLWSKTYSPPEGNITRQFGPVDAVTRVFTMNDKETMQWLGYDLDSGELLWGPIGETRDFNYYPTVGMGGSGQAGFVAYGNLYVGGYGGEYFCYDLTDGTLLWKYDETFSAHETPWGNYPIFPAAIADGKVYLYSGEHSPNAPPYKGSRVRCINATTGEEIWTMLSWGTVGSFADEGWPVADGSLIYLNAYDMQIYCLGKGPSKTTVTAPDLSVSLGDKVLIKGSVTDLSAGTEQNEQAARFPNGVPAVSDASVSEWMEYVYMQKPCPTDAEGVEVVISTLDPNGNTYELGRTTTSLSGTFGIAVEPPVPGTYKIIATFEGSDSYYGSYAETYLIVDEAPSAAAAMEPEATEPTSVASELTAPEPAAPVTTEAVETPFITTETAIIATVAVACAIGVASFWTLRKRK